MNWLWSYLRDMGMVITGMDYGLSGWYQPCSMDNGRFPGACYGAIHGYIHHMFQGKDCQQFIMYYGNTRLMSSEFAFTLLFKSGGDQAMVDHGWARPYTRIHNPNERRFRVCKCEEYWIRLERRQ